MPVPRIGVIIHTTLRDQLFSTTDWSRLLACGEVIATDSATPISVSDAARLLADCEIGVGSWNTPHPNAELLASCPQLQLWEHVAGSVKHMFGPHLACSRITIASCKTAIAENVAEMVLGEIILGLRQVLPNAAANRAGKASKPNGIKVLSESTVGVIAASEVGKRLIARLRHTGCKILLFDPYVSHTQAAEMGAHLMSGLNELCAESDVVTLHTPNIPACRHMIGVRQFSAMKDDTIFINSSRGECVDEAALIAELEKGRLFAFLDVTSPEPPAEDSPLRKLPNVVYTSHIAGPPSFTLGRQAVDDIQAFLAGKQPLCVVTEDQLEYTA